jgi:O-acetylhomoserine (thiol)-lyase
VFEQRLAALEGGVAAVATASGHSAQFLALNNILQVGDNFVTSPFLYGGTFNQFKVSFKRLGVEARFAKDDTAEEIEKLIDSNTKAIYVENLGNPNFNIPDWEKISALAKKYDIPLIVDNTFGAAGFLFRPLEHGANVVVESEPYGWRPGTVWVACDRRWKLQLGATASSQFTNFRRVSGLVFWDVFGPMVLLETLHFPFVCVLKT